MTDNPVNLVLYNPATNPNAGFRQDVTKNLMNSWRRTVRAIGGYWTGFADWEGDPSEMMDIFQTGMFLELRETAGGFITWQGFLAEMVFVHNGLVYTRSWADIANKVKVVYSKMGTNLLSNPGCETVVWDAYNSPSTRERSTTWKTQGDYSAHIVANSIDDGVIIQSSISVSAGQQYQARVTVKIVSGNWRLEIYNSTGGIDQMEQAEVGQWVMTAGIEAEAQISGTVGLRLYCLDASGECYADAGVFQEIADRADTGWVENTNSQNEYGVIELVVSQSGMTDAGALALATQTLNEKAWPRIKPPFQIEQLERETKDRLSLVFLGYVYTLRNFYSDYAGTEDYASDLITGIISEAEFLQPSTISTNQLAFHVEDSENTRAWDLINLIAAAGDDSGNRWSCGVNSGKRFYYMQSSTIPVARIRNGQILSNQGAPLEGWLAEPGMVAIDEGLVAYDIGDRIESRMDRAWMDEVEFYLREYLNGGDGIRYRNTIL